MSRSLHWSFLVSQTASFIPNKLAIVDLKSTLIWGNGYYGSSGKGKEWFCEGEGHAGIMFEEGSSETVGRLADQIETRPST